MKVRKLLALVFLSVLGLGLPIAGLSLLVQAEAQLWPRQRSLDLKTLGTQSWAQSDLPTGSWTTAQPDAMDELYARLRVQTSGRAAFMSQADGEDGEEQENKEEGR